MVLGFAFSFHVCALCVLHTHEYEYACTQEYTRRGQSMIWDVLLVLPSVLLT